MLSLRGNGEAGWVLPSASSSRCHHISLDSGETACNPRAPTFSSSHRWHRLLFFSINVFFGMRNCFVWWQQSRAWANRAVAPFDAPRSAGTICDGMARGTLAYYAYIQCTQASEKARKVWMGVYHKAGVQNREDRWYCLPSSCMRSRDGKTYGKVRDKVDVCERMAVVQNI